MLHNYRSLILDTYLYAIPNAAPQMTNRQFLEAYSDFSFFRENGSVLVQNFDCKKRGGCCGILGKGEEDSADGIYPLTCISDNNGAIIQSPANGKKIAFYMYAACYHLSWHEIA